MTGEQKLVPPICLGGNRTSGCGRDSGVPGSATSQSVVLAVGSTMLEPVKSTRYVESDLTTSLAVSHRVQTM